MIKELQSLQERGSLYRKPCKFLCSQKNNPMPSLAFTAPRIGHLKQDHRLSQNFYKGIKGDNNNVMLAAAAMNFKRMINKWRINPHLFLTRFFLAIIDFLKIQYTWLFKIPTLKMGF